MVTIGVLQLTDSDECGTRSREERSLLSTRLKQNKLLGDMHHFYQIFNCLARSSIMYRRDLAAAYWNRQNGRQMKV